MIRKISTLAILVVAIAFSIATLIEIQMLFAAIGFWSLLIVLIPPFRLFSPWSFVVLTVGIGLTARGIFMSFELPDPDTIDRLYLRGQDPDFFIKPALLLLAGITAMTSGFCFSKFNPRSRPDRSGSWSTSKVRFLGLGTLIVAIASALLYAHFTGGIVPDKISAKRTPIPDLELAGMGFQSFGALRHLASLAIFAHVLVLVNAFRTGNKSEFLLAWALLLVACLQPFYASVRTAVAANLIFSAAVVFFCGGAKSRGNLILFAIATAAIITVMTELRPGNDESWNAAESVVLNRNQIELAKTAHIVQAIPDTLDFQHGRTLLRWFAAPIPREIWPDKPVIHPGPEIGNLVYGQRVAGVPPGLVAEMFWNFGWFGVVPGCALFGIFLRWIDARFSVKEFHPESVALFVSGPMLIGYESVGSSVGSGVFRALLGLAITFAMILVVRKRNPLPE